MSIRMSITYSKFHLHKVYVCISIAFYIQTCTLIFQVVTAKAARTAASLTLCTDQLIALPKPQILRFLNYQLRAQFD